MVTKSTQGTAVAVIESQALLEKQEGFVFEELPVLAMTHESRVAAGTGPLHVSTLLKECDSLGVTPWNDDDVDTSWPG